MKIDTHIFGVHERDSMLLATVDKLKIPDDCIHYDDRPNGGSVIYTAKKAWLAPASEDITHRIVLSDDVDACDGFLDICNQIVKAHPKSIISFFPYEFMKENPEIENVDTPYFKCHIITGVALMMPVEYIEPCFSYIKTRYNDVCADDEGIQAWAEENGIEMLTTIPALIQHIGDDSIANKGCFVRRTVYFERNPVGDFTSKKVMEYKLKEWFFSNNGKLREEKGVLRVVTES